MRVELTIPPKTTRDSPQIVKLVYPDRSISRELIEIPVGHLYLTGLQMYAGGSPLHVLPESGSNTEWIKGNGRTIDKRVRIFYDPPNFEIAFRCYNEDDIYAHTFYVDLE